MALRTFPWSIRGAGYGFENFTVGVLGGLGMVLRTYSGVLMGLGTKDMNPRYYPSDTCIYKFSFFVCLSEPS